MNNTLKNVHELYSKMHSRAENNCIAGAMIMGVLLLGSAWFTLAGPALGEAQDLRLQRQQLQQRVNKLEVLAQSDKAVDITKIRQELEQAETLLPKKPNLTSIAQEVTKRAEEERLEVSSLRIPEIGSGKRHTKLSVELYQLQLELRGDYRNLVNFIQKIEKRYAVRQVSIEGEKNGLVRAEMKVLIAGEV